MSEPLKNCTICLKDKPRSEFRTRLDSKGNRYVTSPCIQCSNEMQKIRYDKSGRQYALKRYRQNRLSTQKFRSMIFEAYGSVCSCCGESGEVFLTIDHKDGDGNVHRQKHGRCAYGVFKDIVKENFPDKYRILCWNCNEATRYGKSCYHEIISSTENVLLGMAC